MVNKGGGSDYDMTLVMGLQLNYIRNELERIIQEFALFAGATVRARHVPGGVALPAAAAPRRAPLREGVQHRQAVQAVLLQAGGAVPEHGGRITLFELTISPESFSIHKYVYKQLMGIELGKR